MSCMWKKRPLQTLISSNLKQTILDPLVPRHLWAVAVDGGRPRPWDRRLPCLSSARGNFNVDLWGIWFYDGYGLPIFPTMRVYNHIYSYLIFFGNAIWYSENWVDLFVPKCQASSDGKINGFRLTCSIVSISGKYIEVKYIRKHPEYTGNSWGYGWQWVSENQQTYWEHHGLMLGTPFLHPAMGTPPVLTIFKVCCSIL